MSPDQAPAVILPPDSPLVTQEAQLQPGDRPFSVKNRSRAEKLVKLLWGPKARTWVNRPYNAVTHLGPDSTTYEREIGCVVGTEVGSARSIMGGGRDWSAALKHHVSDYLWASSSQQDMRARFQRAMPYAIVDEFWTPVLKKVQALEAERAAAEKLLKSSVSPKFKWDEG